MYKQFFIIGLVFFGFLFQMTACEEATDNEVTDVALTEQDRVALAFMLEEEKLAHDTYVFLDSLWNINQFSNIRWSEQRHMDMIIELYDAFNIDYDLLDFGKFNNAELQTLYDDLTEQGSVSEISALTVGATIEDLDIKDLQDYLESVDNKDIINTFEKLQCASRNHMRAFIKGLNMRDATYVPQYITADFYDEIINGEHENCGCHEGGKQGKTSMQGKAQCHGKTNAKAQCQGKGNGKGKGGCCSH